MSYDELFVVCGGAEEKNIVTEDKEKELEKIKEEYKGCEERVEVTSVRHYHPLETHMEDEEGMSFCSCAQYETDHTPDLVIEPEEGDEEEEGEGEDLYGYAHQRVALFLTWAERNLPIDVVGRVYTDDGEIEMAKEIPDEPTHITCCVEREGSKASVPMFIYSDEHNKVYADCGFSIMSLADAIREKKVRAEKYSEEWHALRNWLNDLQDQYSL